MYLYVISMKKIFYFFIVLLLMGNTASAQFTKAELQAAGLTCSLCSKSVDAQLKKLDFIDSIHIDLAHATFILYFKKDKPVDFYQIKKSVENAGFSVSMLKTTCKVDNLLINNKGHFNYQNTSFFALNKGPQILNGEVTFQIVDKGFISNKEYKKYMAAQPNSQGNNLVYDIIF